MPSFLLYFPKGATSATISKPAPATAEAELHISVLGIEPSTAVVTVSYPPDSSIKGSPSKCSRLSAMMYSRTSVNGGKPEPLAYTASPTRTEPPLKVPSCRTPRTCGTAGSGPFLTVNGIITFKSGLNLKKWTTYSPATSISWPCSSVPMSYHKGILLIFFSWSESTIARLMIFLSERRITWISHCGRPVSASAFKNSVSKL